MGSRSGSQTETQNQSGTSSVSLAPRSGSEQQILNQFQGLGDQQLSFLNGLLNGQTSPYALNTADQAQLDQAYNSAFNQFNQAGKDYADYLATTRGLNKSDTPVSQQAMQRYGLGMSDLLSQKANQGLNMGLQGTNLRLMGTQMAPSGLQLAFNPQFQERLATPTQTSSGNMTGTVNSTYNPSLMDNIGQGMGLAAGAGLMAGGLMTGNPLGLGGMSTGGGMGSGASANSWFGPSPGGELGGMGSFFVA